MTAPILIVERLCAYYGRAQLLFDVSFSVKAGEVLLLVGGNGAGKSTTLKAVMGLLPKLTGHVHFAGNVISGRSPHEIARLGLGYVPEERRIFTDLSVAENLEIGRQPRRMHVSDAPHWDLNRVGDLFPKLVEMLNRSAAHMSGGEQQMLTIARTLMGNPRAILLDEPSEGLAPIVLERIAASIQLLKREGMTIVLSEQNMHFARSIADRAVLLDRGTIRFDGTFQALEADSELRRRYLVA